MAQVSEYAFDALYNSEDTTSKVFKDLALPLVSLLIEGFNGTIFAYGQTGSGKTHSMMGNEKDPGTCVQPSQAKKACVAPSSHSSLSSLVRAQVLRHVW